MNMFSFKHCALCSMDERFHRNNQQGHQLRSYCSTQAVILEAFKLQHSIFFSFTSAYLRTQKLLFS